MGQLIMLTGSGEGAKDVL